MSDSSGRARPRDFPDGISRADADGRPASPLLLRLVPTLLLGAVVAASLTGAFGGTPNPTHVARSARGELTVNAPSVLRSGEFFEMRFRIRATAPLSDATLTVQQAYLRDLTINTQVPAAEKETATGEVFRFSYGPLAAGDSIAIKLDGQVNPTLFLGTEGYIAAGDGEDEFARIPLELTVLP